MTGDNWADENAEQVPILRLPLAWSDFVLDLQELAAEHGWKAYLVGGVVRDAYLRRPTKDIDLVTLGSGTRLARQMADVLGGAYFALDHERDIGRVIVTRGDERLEIDISRARGDSLAADLADRDFTINAMAVELAGDPEAVHDPLNGMGDLRAKVLRQCRPDAIARDPVRALRAVRQSVQFGLKLEPDTREAARAAASSLSTISPERLRDEFFKMLCLSKPTTALRVARALGLLNALLPEWTGREEAEWADALLVVERVVGVVTTISPQRTDETAAQFAFGMLVMAIDKYRPRLQTHLAHEWPEHRSHSALLCLGALLSPIDANAAAERARALKLSADEANRIAGMIAHAPNAQAAQTDPLSIYRFWRVAGKSGVDAILLGLAQYLAAHALNLPQDTWLVQVERAAALLNAFYEQSARLVSPPALVNGDDLQNALHIKPGANVGRLLEAIREAQVKGEVATAEDALNYARALLPTL